MPTSNDHDIIVIGSGIGGLTAAGLLARVAHKRVLVLERHLEPGGLTHSFRRDGASWDVGVHYIGQLGEGSPNRRLFDYLSAGQLRWRQMPEDFERFIHPGLDFRVPSDADAYRQRLIDSFPDERSAIKQYFRDVNRAARWAGWHFMQDMVPGFFVPVLRLLRRLDQRFGAQTTGDYLKKHIRTPALRALLTTQWADYGLSPARSPFALHATIVTHYLQGAWFPLGGSSQMARTIETVLERHGGAIRVGQEVTAIALDERGHACGVHVTDRRGATPQRHLLRAPIIISAIGARPTYESLLPTDGPVGQRTAPIRKQIQSLGHGLSAVVLYLRLATDPRQLGVEGENLWINTALDPDDLDGMTRDLLAGKPRHLYVSFPSIKAGHTRAHTVEIIAFVDPKAFARWKSTTHRQRGEDYEKLKATISAGMMRTAGKVMPGLEQAVIHQELSTPLSVEHYTGHPQGAFYGLPATTERFLGEAIRARTPVEGLYLAGQDACMLGIMGAMMGGMAAACQVLGPARGYPMIQQAIRQAANQSARILTASARPSPAMSAVSGDASPPADASVLPDSPLPADKYRATLISRRQLTPLIWEVAWALDGKVGAFAAGQFARLHVGHHQWRDYSIAGLGQISGEKTADSGKAANQILTLLVSTRTGGDGSRFIEHTPIGTRTQVELPLGDFTLNPGKRRQVFVATGTGLAPFLPMFTKLDRPAREQAILLFGCRGTGDDLIRLLSSRPAGSSPQAFPCWPGTLVHCHSREMPAKKAGDNALDGLLAGNDAATTTPHPDPHDLFLHGRVTAALGKLPFDPEQTDFYLCGASGMVSDCRQLLMERGARHVWVEMY